MARSFWETACQPNPGRFRPHSLPWMIITPAFLLFFIQYAKTDTYWQGPWVTGLPMFSKVVSYPQFLSRLKAWGADIGLNPNDLGTHSLHRGLASDWALSGVPDRLL
jgi:hypothetical protein